MAAGVLWLTGPPAAGKTTLASATVAALHAAGRAAVLLDGDELRAGLSRDLGFAEADRAEQVRRAAEVARLVAASGAWAVVALVSPYAAHRAAARRRCAPFRFLEVHVHAPPAVLAARDLKGLYARARAGALAGLTGVDAPYEVPDAPELALDTAALAVDAAAARIIALVEPR
jgi:adenylyl-sulfate kinase